MADRVIQRHDTAARWQQFNPILAEGEIGIETDGAKGYKIGDGKTAWNSLPYPANPASVVQETGDSESAVMSQKAVTEKLTELGSEVEIINAVVATEQEEIAIIPFRDNVFVDNSLSVVSSDGYAISNCITLNKGESVIAKFSTATSVSAISRMSHYNGWGNPIEMLSIGKGKSTYTYTALEDNVYIQFSYNKSYDISCVKIISKTISQIIDEQEIVHDELFNDAELKQKRDYEVYPLVQGIYNIADGSIIDHSSRMTTGIVLNNKPLSLWVNSGYSVAYAYGDKKDNLADGGYIISNPSVRTNLIVGSDAKYLVFNISRADGGNFSNPNDSGFFLSRQDSNAELINSKTANIAIWDNTPNLYLGITRTDGTIYEMNQRKTTKLIEIDGEDIYISLANGYSCVVAHGDTINSLTEIGYVIRGGGSYVYKGGKKYIALNIAHVSSKDLTDDGVEGFVMCKAKSNMGKLADELNELRKIVPALKKEQLSNAVTISDSNDTLVVSDGWDINGKGFVCAGMTAASSSIGEHNTPNTRIALAVANLADVEGTKEVVDVLLPNQYIDGVGYIERAMNGLAKWIDNDTISVFMRVIARVGDNIQRYACISCTYNVNTKELSPLALCDINVQGTIYQMYTEFDLNNNGAATSDSISKINDIWDKTGIEHPLGYGNKDSYTFYLGQNPKKVYDKFYAAISLGNFSHALCKSADLISWEFVCDIPFGQSSEEVAICYYNNKIYATSRGNYDIDKQYSKMMYCPFDSLAKESWSEPKTLSMCRNERPTIAGLDGRIYIMQGYSTKAIIDGMEVSRANKVLFVCDADLNILRQTDMTFTYPLLHPQFMVYNGNMFACTSTDKRCFGYIGGDTRSELGLSHIDIDIFKM